MSDEPLALVPICHYCGARAEPIPVDGGAGGRWWPAVAWSLIALDSHKKVCPVLSNALDDPAEAR